ncbi:hypothetical protein BDV98DRAFT_565407 [Pterulicium gracile]|uniref:Uncharacterized protein n=1 Tax=Pterulicium gracile TaxID=1884261 RepID=A0A5C3QME6_9AGAR|nr:hypothetical protein BDV98DRAFT_565407 [Pterula gracilis]
MQRRSTDAWPEGYAVFHAADTTEVRVPDCCRGLPAQLASTGSQLSRETTRADARENRYFRVYYRHAVRSRRPKRGSVSRTR